MNNDELQISIDRQVKIVAGSLVLIGVLGSYFIHPMFIILSGLIGCGLLYAGISNSCMMCYLLSKMFWNKR